MDERPEGATGPVRAAKQVLKEVGEDVGEDRTDRKKHN